LLLVLHVLRVPNVHVSQNHTVTTIEESKGKDWIYNEKCKGGDISVKPVMCIVSFVGASDATFQKSVLNSALNTKYSDPSSKDGDENDGGDNKHVIVNYCVGLHLFQGKRAMVRTHTHTHVRTHMHMIIR
jgi:hypothetical protein